VLTLQPSYLGLFAAGAALLGSSVILGCCFVVTLACKYGGDPGLGLWRGRSKTNSYVLNAVVSLACLRMGLLRLAYCRLFGRECFSCYLRAHASFLRVTNWFGLGALLLSGGSIALALLFLLNELGGAQAKIYAIDCLILGCLEVALLVLDMCHRGKEHFKGIVDSLPYLRKFRKYQDLESSDGSLISIQEPEDAHCKTEAEHQAATLPIGGFGTFSEDANQHDKTSIVKTLPEHQFLHGHIAFDPYEEKRKNDDLFFQEQEYTRKFNLLKDSYEREEEQEEGESLPEDTNTEYGQALNRDKTVEEIIFERPREVDPADFLSGLSPQDRQEVSPAEL
jgi:hypothetical protein